MTTIQDETTTVSEDMTTIQNETTTVSEDTTTFQDEYVLFIFLGVLISTSLLLLIAALLLFFRIPKIIRNKNERTNSDRIFLSDIVSSSYSATIPQNKNVSVLSYHSENFQFTKF